MRGTSKSGRSSERRRAIHSRQTNFIMNRYADSSNRAASGKNNQSSFAKATEDKPTNNHPLTILQAYKRLSCRECEVLEKIGEDKSCQQIADELFLSKKTIENHVTNIGKKLKLEGRGLLRKWIRSQKD